VVLRAITPWRRAKRSRRNCCRRKVHPRLAHGTAAGIVIDDSLARSGCARSGTDGANLLWRFSLRIEAQLALLPSMRGISALVG